MDAILSFVVLSLLTIGGAWAVNRAKQFRDGVDDRRQTLESLAGMCQSGVMNLDESRAVKVAIESRLRQVT